MCCLTSGIATRLPAPAFTVAVPLQSFDRSDKLRAKRRLPCRSKARFQCGDDFVHFQFLDVALTPQGRIRLRLGPSPVSEVRADRQLSGALDRGIWGAGVRSWPANG